MYQFKFRFRFRKVPFGRKTEKKKTNLASIFNRKFLKVVSSLSIDDTLMHVKFRRAFP